MYTEEQKELIDGIGMLLNNEERPMKERFRALFTLRSIKGTQSVEWMKKCFSSPSALLKHECAYCLGQMKDPSVVPFLEGVLKDPTREPIVRHEAAEALGAIGKPSCLALLEKYSNDPVREVAETCELTIAKIKLQRTGTLPPLPNPFLTEDPAPPFVLDMSTQELESILLDEQLDLFYRYRAMFSLRNQRTNVAVRALAKGLRCRSALFRHEIAFVLGQIQNDACEEQLAERLRDLNENEMVRHECAEALGSIASKNCKEILTEFLTDEKRIVRESVEVALDMCEYEKSSEFQYANLLMRLL